MQQKPIAINWSGHFMFQYAISLFAYELAFVLSVIYYILHEYAWFYITLASVAFAIMITLRELWLVQRNWNDRRLAEGGSRIILLSLSLCILSIYVCCLLIYLSQLNNPRIPGGYMIILFGLPPLITFITFLFGDSVPAKSGAMIR